MKKLFTLIISFSIVLSFFSISKVQADDVLSGCEFIPNFYKNDTRIATNGQVAVTDGARYKIQVYINAPSGGRCQPPIFWKLTLVEQYPAPSPNEPGDNVDRGIIQSGRVPSGLEVPGGGAIFPYAVDVPLGDAGLHTYAYTLHIAVDSNFQNAYHTRSNAITFVQSSGGGTGNGNSNNQNNNGGNNSNNRNNNNNNTTNNGKPTTIGGYQNYDQNIGTLDNPLKAKTVPELITRIIRILLLLIAMVAIIMIIFGGFRMVTSQGDPGALATAKKTIIWAIIGLVVALMSFSIVAIIQNLIQN